MAETGLVQILEGAILAAGRPLSVQNMADLFEEHERPENSVIRDALKEVAERCEDRGFELSEVASGYRFQVRQQMAQWVGRLWHERPARYSRALLETLSLIAYRQPITRGEIEEIRGVAVSSNIIKTLHEREWIRVVGHRDVPGRPAMYATTRDFLDYFDLKSLDQLPALAEIRDFDTLTQELGFEGLVDENAKDDAEGEADIQVDDEAANDAAEDAVAQENGDVEIDDELATEEDALEVEELEAEAAEVEETGATVEIEDLIDSDSESEVDTEASDADRRDQAADHNG
jgi:segregation and condensation protein B